jgi:cell division protein ZapD
VVHYEFPLTEGIRTCLRVAALLDRLDRQTGGDSVTDHHGALVTLFELADIAARVDLKGELLRELERHRASLQALRHHPAVDTAMLQHTLGRLGAAQDGLVGVVGKLGAQLAATEFLVSVKSRISIPAGTCEFDLPAYHAWKQRAPDQRRDDLAAWCQPLQPYAKALDLLLELVRAAGQGRQETARAGAFQTPLGGTGRPIVLVRVSVDEPSPTHAIPEVSGHRLLLSIRMMRLEADGQLRPRLDDVPFGLVLCPGA